MKNDRQTAVLQIIEETAVETQEQLMQLLAGPWLCLHTGHRFLGHQAAASDEGTGRHGRISLCCVGTDAQAEF